MKTYTHAYWPSRTGIARPVT
uniref:Uncharacterized protein n=1 Tax=Anguilla anguilla TaxID=7936 RepID=A0A0E9QJG0_ANGAN